MALHKSVYYYYYYCTTTPMFSIWLLGLRCDWHTQCQLIARQSSRPNTLFGQFLSQSENHSFLILPARTLGTVQLHTIQIHYRLRHGQLGPDKLFIYLLHPKAAHNTSQLQIQRNTHAAHAHTTAAHSAVTPTPCHLHLVSLSAPHLKICPPA